MPLKIIGAGFGRTGTMSIYTALNQLGFPCYHMLEVLENKDNKSHLDFWRKVANTPPGTQHDWEAVFAKYAAAVDNPACSVWRELVAAYPDARVLLSLHPGGADAWYESTRATIYFTESLWQFKVLQIATPFARKLGDMCHKLIWQRAHRGTMNDRAKAIIDYHRHIADVRAAVPADRLLVFTVNEGWQPLCDFIGVPVPQAPFPRVNDRAQFKQVINGLTRGAYTMLALAAAMIASAIGAAIWYSRQGLPGQPSPAAASSSEHGSIARSAHACIDPNPAAGPAASCSWLTASSAWRLLAPLFRRFQTARLRFLAVCRATARHCQPLVVVRRAEFPRRSVATRAGDRQAVLKTA